MVQSIFAILALIILGYTVGSVRIVSEGNEALVERLGRYRRKLNPGLNFIVPVLDAIVLEDTTRERLLDVEPQPAITRDNVPLEVDAVVYWRILDLERTYYEVEDVEQAIQELVITTLRSELGKMEFENTFASRDELNKALLDQLDEATETWGVKVTRVEVQSIEPPASVKESMQQQQAAAIKKKAAILEAEGTVQSMRLLSEAFGSKESSRDILNFLIAQRYIETNERLGASENSKIVFIDPKALNEGLVELMNHLEVTEGGSSSSNGRT